MIEFLIVGLLFEAAFDAMTRRSHEIPPDVYDRMLRDRLSLAVWLDTRTRPLSWRRASCPFCMDPEKRVCGMCGAGLGPVRRS